MPWDAIIVLGSMECKYNAFGWTIMLGCEYFGFVKRSIRQWQRNIERGANGRLGPYKFFVKGDELTFASFGPAQSR